MIIIFCFRNVPLTNGNVFCHCHKLIENYENKNAYTAPSHKYSPTCMLLKKVIHSHSHNITDVSLSCLWVFAACDLVVWSSLTWGCVVGSCCWPFLLYV